MHIKQGRSGRFAVVEVEHRVFIENGTEPVLIETLNNLLREAGGAAALIAPRDVTNAVTTTAARTASAAASSAAPGAAATPIPTRPIAQHTLTPDERLLFRYSAITDNAHRIHYDQAYALGQEGYPALVVNGSIPTMFLLGLFRRAAGREPAVLRSRNIAPMFCVQPLHLKVGQDAQGWRLWAQDDPGHTSFDARVE